MWAMYLLIQFRLEFVLDAIRFRLFLKSPDYKYVPYVIRKEENVITFAINNSRRIATPNLKVSSK